MSTTTPTKPASTSDLVAGPKHAPLFASSPQLRSVELDEYVDAAGQHHVLLAVFGHNDTPPRRWRVFDAVLVDETAALEPLEHAAAIAAIYVNEKTEETR